MNNDGENKNVDDTSIKEVNEQLNNEVKIEDNKEIDKSSEEKVESESNDPDKEIIINDGSNIDYLKPQPPVIKEEEKIEEVEPKKEEDDILFMEKPKRHWGGLIASAVILLLLVAAAYGYYNIILSPKNMVNSSINYLDKIFFTKLFNNIDENEDRVSIEGKIDISNNIPGYDEFNDYSAEYSAGADLTKELIKLDMDLKINGQNIEAFVGYKEHNSYLYISDFLPRMLRTAVNTQKGLKEIYEEKLSDKDDYIYLLELIGKSVFNNISYNKAKKSISKEKIDGKDKMVIKSTFVFDKEQNAKITEAIYNDVTKDEKVLKIYAKLIDDEVSAAKEDLKEVLQASDEVFSVSVMTNLVNSKLLKLELKSDNKEDGVLAIEIIDSKYINVYKYDNDGKEKAHVKYGILTKKTDIAINNISNDKDVLTINSTYVQERSNVGKSLMVIEYKKDLTKTESLVVTIDNAITTGENIKDFSTEGSEIYENWSSSEKDSFDYLSGSFFEMFSSLIEG